MTPACSGDDEALGPDAGTDDVGDGGDGDARPGAGQYDDPGDFDRADCDGVAPLDEAGLAGIWHLDIEFSDFGAFPGALRLDLDGSSLSARLFGAPTDEVRVTAEDVFIRRAWTSEQQGERVRVLDACTLQEDGGLWGHYASCTGEECFLGTFTAYPVEPLEEPVTEGLTVLSHHQGPGDQPWPLEGDITVNVRAREGIAYLPRYGDGLRIVDLSDPTTPVDRGHAAVMYEDFEIYNDVKIVDGPDQKRYAIAASNIRGAVVIDVTDPDAPSEVTTFPPPPAGEQRINVHTLFVEGGRAYLANTTTSGLDIFDVSDPASPQRLGEWVHPTVEVEGGYLHDLFVRDGRAFLNYWNLGMVIVDTMTDPSAPTMVGVFDGYERRTSHSNWVTDVAGRTVSVHGDEDFGAHVRIVDVDPSSDGFLTTLSEYQTRAHVSVHNILAHEQLAFVTYYQDGLRVLDLSNPSDPVEIAHHQTWPGAEAGLGDRFYEGAMGVDYDETTGHIYVVDSHTGLWVLTLDR